MAGTDLNSRSGGIVSEARRLSVLFTVCGTLGLIILLLVVDIGLSTYVGLAGAILLAILGFPAGQRFERDVRLLSKQTTARSRRYWVLQLSGCVLIISLVGGTMIAVGSRLTDLGDLGIDLGVVIAYLEIGLLFLGAIMYAFAARHS